MNKVKFVSNTERLYYNQFIWNHNLAKIDGQKGGVET